ncbi:MAG: glycosyltransferase family 4 protein [Acetobacterales bacterium]
MKILFLSDNFPPETNAAATRVFERAVYWARWGHEVTVITCAPNFPEGRLFAGYANRWRHVETLSGIRVVRVKTYMAPNAGTLRRTLDFLSFMVTGFLAALREKRPDVVAATSPQFFAAVAGWAIGLVRRRPFVFELGDLWPKSIIAVGAYEAGLVLRTFERLELFLYRRAACVAALTHAFRDDLIARGIPGAKIAVVINGVDLARYEPRPRDTALLKEWGLEGRFVLGYVGTHGMAHGLRNVLDAAEKLRDAPAVTFLLVGAGAERAALLAEAEARGLDNVVFAPAQPKHRMPMVWSLCDVALVHLRDTEAFREVVPSKMFEAMAMGLPLLMVLPKGEASGIAERERVGLWVPPEDPDALAQAARTLANQPEVCQSMGRRSRDTAPKYSREKQSRRMLAVLRIAAEGRGHEVASVVGVVPGAR